MEQINVTKRTTKGKIACRKLRKQGLIPATLYHRGDESMEVCVQDAELRRVLRHHGDSGLVNLVFEDGSAANQQAIYKHVITDVFKRKLLHLDLQGVRAGEKVTLTLPVVLKGMSRGVTEQGGILVQQLDEIVVRCEPRYITERIEIDITNLNLHEAIHASDLQLPEGNELYGTEARAVIASVVEPKKTVVAVETPVEGAEGAEGAAAAPAAAAADAGKKAE